VRFDEFHGSSEGSPAKANGTYFAVRACYQSHW